jgi:Chaperone of endosialidase
MPSPLFDVPAQVNGTWQLANVGPGIQFHTFGGGVPSFYTQQLIQFTSQYDDTVFETGVIINFQANSGYGTTGSFTNGKSGLLIACEATANAGHIWAQSNDLIIDAGYNPVSNFAVNTELDVSNNSSGDTTPVTGTLNVFQLFLSGFIGASPITAAIFYGPIGSGPVYAAHWGIGFSGEFAVKDATIVDGTNATYSYQDNGSHTVGLYLNGKYSLAPIVGPNFNVDALGHFNTTSDVALKIDLAPIDDAADKLRGIRGYRFRHHSGEPDIGVIAQEVERAFPEAVSERDGVKHVNYAALIAPLIEVHNNMRRRIEELELRVDLLEGKSHGVS